MTRNMTRKSESPDKIGAFCELATGIGQSVKCSFYAWLRGFYHIYYKYSYFLTCINRGFAVIGFKSMTRKYDTGTKIDGSQLRAALISIKCIYWIIFAVLGILLPEISLCPGVYMNESALVIIEANALEEGRCVLCKLLV